jgi:hypothetical protein
MPLDFRKIFKDLSAGKVIATRMSHLRETAISISPTTNSPENATYTKRRISSEAVDIIELVSPVVQAVAGTIPVAGIPLKAAVDGLLYVVQIIDVGHLFYSWDIF